MYIWSYKPGSYLVHSGTLALYLASPLVDLGAHDNIRWFRRKGNSVKYSGIMPKLLRESYILIYKLVVTGLIAVEYIRVGRTGINAYSIGIKL